MSHRNVRALKSATLTKTAPHFQSNGRAYTASQKRGMAYEKKVQAAFLEKYDHLYLPSPWFHYEEEGSGRKHYCQPDGLLFNPSRQRIVIVEIKLQHTRMAYQQLFNLYRPVVEHVFSPWNIGCCEITRWYDPAEPVPVPARLCRQPDDVNLGVFGVHILKA